MKKSIGEDVGKSEPLCTAGGNINGQQCGGYSKIFKKGLQNK